MIIRLFAERLGEERSEKAEVEEYLSERLPDGSLKTALGPHCKIIVTSGSANILLENASPNAAKLLANGKLLDVSYQNQLSDLLFKSSIYSPDVCLLDAWEVNDEKEKNRQGKADEFFIPADLTERVGMQHNRPLLDSLRERFGQSNIFSYFGEKLKSTFDFLKDDEPRFLPFWEEINRQALRKNKDYFREKDQHTFDYVGDSGFWVFLGPNLSEPAKEVRRAAEGIVGRVALEAEYIPQAIDFGELALCVPPGLESYLDKMPSPWDAQTTRCVYVSGLQWRSYNPPMKELYDRVRQWIRYPANLDSGRRCALEVLRISGCTGLEPQWVADLVNEDAPWSQSLKWVVVGLSATEWNDAPGDFERKVWAQTLDKCKRKLVFVDPDAPSPSELGLVGRDAEVQQRARDIAFRFADKVADVYLLLDVV